MEECRNALNILRGKPTGNRPLRRCWRKDGIIVDLKGIGVSARYWTDLAKDKECYWRALHWTSRYIYIPTYVFAVVKWADSFLGVPRISPVLGRTVSGSTFRWHLSHLFLYMFLLLVLPRTWLIMGKHPKNHRPIYIRKLLLNYLFFYLFFHRRPTHQLCFLSCMPFVVNATFSTGLVGCRSFFIPPECMNTVHEHN